MRESTITTKRYQTDIRADRHAARKMDNQNDNYTGNKNDQFGKQKTYTMYDYIKMDQRTYRQAQGQTTPSCWRRKTNNVMGRRGGKVERKCKREEEDKRTGTNNKQRPESYEKNGVGGEGGGRERRLLTDDELC